MTGHERRTTVARRRGTSAASPPNPEGISTDELGEGTSVPYSVSASLKLVDGVRDLDLERLPTPRAARSATGHGGGNSSVDRDVCRISTVTARTTPSVTSVLVNTLSSLVSGRGPGKGGIAKVPLLAPCGELLSETL